MPSTVELYPQHFWNKRRAGTSGLTLCLTLLTLALSSSANASEEGAVLDDEPSQDVLAALEPGGDAYALAQELNAQPSSLLAERGDLAPDGSAPDTSFGAPRLSVYLDLAANASGSLGTEDLGDRGGTVWISVEYVDGRPYSTMELDDRGNLVSLDGLSLEEVEALDRAPLDAIFATDGRFGEAYAITDDGSTVLALNKVTEQFIGGSSTSVDLLRELKAEHAAAWAEVEPHEVESGAIGGAQSGMPRDAPEDQVPWAAYGLVIGSALLVGWLVTRRGRSDRRVGDGSVV